MFKKAIPLKWYVIACTRTLASKIFVANTNSLCILDYKPAVFVYGMSYCSSNTTEHGISNLQVDIMLHNEVDRHLHAGIHLYKGSSNIHTTTAHAGLYIPVQMWVCGLGVHIICFTSTAHV